MGNNTNISKILTIIFEKLQGIEFAFIGSINLYIQGLKVEPRDIDILTTLEGIKQIDEILSEFRIKEIYFDKSDGRNSFRSFYKINGVEIEVLGNVNNIYRNPESLDKKVYMEFGKIKLPCMPLVNELAVYKKMRRKEKAGMIQEFLRGQK